MSSLLTHKHYISIDTNFTANNLKAFADNIDPSKVYRIDAAFHVEERMKRQQVDGIYGFIENVNYFQNKGFNIRVEYVLYPSLFKRVIEDIELLYNSGIRRVNIKPFVGYYRKQYYPKSYTTEEKTLMQKHMKDNTEVDIINNRNRFFGYNCHSGVNSFVMDIQGNLRRCMTSHRIYGNLFKGKYQFDEKARPCSHIRCICPYEGIKGVRGDKGTIGSISSQVMEEIPPFVKNKAKIAKVVRYLEKRFTSLEE